MFTDSASDRNKLWAVLSVADNNGQSGEKPAQSFYNPGNTMVCAIAWLTVLILFPVILLLWLTESKQQKARRFRSYGLSQQKIADRLGCSRTTARRLLGASC